MGYFKELSIEWMEEIEKYNRLAVELAAAVTAPSPSADQPTPLWLEILPFLEQQASFSEEI